MATSIKVDILQSLYVNTNIYTPLLMKTMIVQSRCNKRKEKGKKSNNWSK